MCRWILTCLSDSCRLLDYFQALLINLSSGEHLPEFCRAEWLSPGTPCFSLTWLTVPTGTGALILQKGEIRVINQTTCEDLMPQQITPRMMCVGFLTGGVDSCQVCGLAGERRVGGRGA